MIYAYKNYIARGVNLAIQIAIFPIAVKNLDPTDAAVVIIAFAVYGVIANFDFGLGLNLLRLASRSRGFAINWLQSSAHLLIMIVLIFLLLSLILLFSIPYLNQIAIIIWSMILIMGTGQIGNIIANYYLAIGKGSQAGNIHLTISSVNALYIFFASQSNFSANYLCIGLAVIFTSISLIFFCFSPLCKKSLLQHRIILKRINRKQIIIIKGASKLAYIQIATALSFYVNSIILYQIMSDQQVIEYSLIFRVFFFPTFIFAPILHMQWAALSQKGGKENTWLMFNASVIVLAITVLLAAMLDVISNILIEEMISLSFPEKVVCILYPFSHFYLGYISVRLNAKGDYSINAILASICLIITFSVTYLASPLIGITGPLLATISGIFLTYVPVHIKYIR